MLKRAQSLRIYVYQVTPASKKTLKGSKLFLILWKSRPQRLQLTLSHPSSQSDAWEKGQFSLTLQNANLLHVANLSPPKKGRNQVYTLLHLSILSVYYIYIVIYLIYVCVYTVCVCVYIYIYMYDSYLFMDVPFPKLPQIAPRSKRFKSSLTELTLTPTGLPARTIVLSDRGMILDGFFPLTATDCFFQSQALSPFEQDQCSQ